MVAASVPAIIAAVVTIVPAAVTVAAIFAAVAVVALRRCFGRNADAGHQQPGGEDLSDFHVASFQPCMGHAPEYEPPRVSFLNAAVGWGTGLWGATGQGAAITEGVIMWLFVTALLGSLYDKRKTRKLTE